MYVAYVCCIRTVSLCSVYVNVYVWAMPGERGLFGGAGRRAPLGGLHVFMAVCVCSIYVNTEEVFACCGKNSSFRWFVGIHGCVCIMMMARYIHTYIHIHTYTHAGSGPPQSNDA